MTARNQDFTMYSGNTKTLVVTIYGENVDLTGSTITWGLANDEDSTTLLLTKTSNDSIEIVDSTNIQITLKPEDTSMLKGNYYQECKCVDVNKEVSTLFSGFIEIKHSHV